MCHGLLTGIMLVREVAGGAWGLPGSFLADSAGSRLPLPPTWPITDIYAASPTQPQPPLRPHTLPSIPEEEASHPQADTQAQAGTSTHKSKEESATQAQEALGCALVLWLALEVEGASVCAGAFAGGCTACLQAE